MKALTLYQPWASAIALGNKRVETRSWRTNYRGPLAIHAGRHTSTLAAEFAMTERMLGRLPHTKLPLGAIVCFTDVLECIPVEEARLRLSQDGPASGPGSWGLEHLYGDYSSGRWAWMFGLVQTLKEPIFVTGARGLWEWNGTVPL